MPHGQTRFIAKGYCIYCNSISSQLTDEHVVPFSLGGQHILPQASCLTCANITKKFEQNVARGLWGDARISYDAPSRRKSERPKQITLKGTSPHDPELTIAYCEYPAPMVFYKLPQAGLLQGLPPSHDLSPTWQLVSIADENRIKKFLQKHPGRLTAKFRHVPGSFGRMIAKIGYCQILCSLDSSEFDPICLPYILGAEPNLSFVVGGRSSLAEPNPNVGYMLNSHFVGTSESAMLVAEVRLFANNGTPTYHVVVGFVRGKENTAKVKNRLSAFSIVEMPEAFATSTPPPEHLHWLPRIWPIGI